MASINFNQPIFADSQKKYLYSDLHLDLTQENIYTSAGDTTTKKKSDIMLDYNIDAIKNSINNIFNTKKGQRPLYPDLSVDLEQYLFEPINEDTAFKIGKEVQRSLTKYESRVVIAGVHVSVNESYDGYNVSISLFIPALSINTIINASASYNGFIIK